MRKIGLIIYSILYVLGFISLILAAFTSYFYLLGLIVYAIGILILCILIIKCMLPQIPKNYLILVKNTLLDIVLDRKHKLLKREKAYFHISSILFLVILIIGLFVRLLFDRPELVNEIYLVTRSGFHIAESISRFQFHFINFFQTQMYGSLSLLISSSMIIHLRKTKEE